MEGGCRKPEPDWGCVPVANRSITRKHPATGAAAVRRHGCLPRRHRPVVDLKAAVLTSRDGPCVRAVGQVDMDSAPVLHTALDQALDTGCRHLHVDLTGVRFIDSCGLHVLLDARRRLLRQGGVLTVAPSTRMVGLLEMTQTRPLFPSSVPPGRADPTEEAS
ncbi:STAS domain-containing protein [Yinghuangia soli]|uniref:Anti-sigma factor antagonist n=1 Tax=Yinghuangia soli TaxID=2908204 RepID=A0AA41PWN4_9ACTN|nr:STAS domain-containing protein [Yinghuangia soli]MCF2527194.1 STAS domain-containing protein [Yinghuangia soli]